MIIKSVEKKSLLTNFHIGNKAQIGDQTQMKTYKITLDKVGRGLRQAHSAAECEK